MNSRIGERLFSFQSRRQSCVRGLREYSLAPCASWISDGRNSNGEVMDFGGLGASVCEAHGRIAPQPDHAALLVHLEAQKPCLPGAAATGRLDLQVEAASVSMTTNPGRLHALIRQHLAAASRLAILTGHCGRILAHGCGHRDTIGRTNPLKKQRVESVPLPDEPHPIETAGI
jgi:hypothetical protein